jgi:hypothetical protein
MFHQGCGASLAHGLLKLRTTTTKLSHLNPCSPAINRIPKTALTIALAINRAAMAFQRCKLLKRHS